MKCFMCLILTGSFAVAASASDHYTDRVEFDVAGNKVVVRTSSIIDGKGVKRHVEQRLDQVDENTFIYDPNIQSEATNQFHQEFCAQRGLVPSTDGETVISGAIGGWSCHESATQNNGAIHDAWSAGVNMSKAADYVIARAPTGVVATGNFLAFGYVTAESSQGGVLTAKVSADGGRCNIGQSWPFSGAFSYRREIWVNCVVDRPRVISTRTEACIPKHCAADSATMTVR